jgi:hypothetical protein
MKEPREQIDELMIQASMVPHGATKTALLEEAVQRADAVQDVDLAFDARNELMSAATFSGRPDILLVAFSWCIAQLDRNPDRFDAFDLLWKFKWVMSNGIQFPEIARRRLEELLVDMERRYREAGSTLHAVASERRAFQVHVGDRAAARAAHADLRKYRRDFFSDCAACAANSNCKYYCFQRQWSRAVQAAQPVLRGKLSCAEEPHCVLATVLLPLFHLKRLDEAKACQCQGYRLVSRGSQFVRQHSQHLRFMVLIGDLAQSKRMLERHLPGALETIMVDERFDFLLAARLWTDRFGEGTRKLKLRLPKGVPQSDESKFDISRFRDWLTQEADKIAQRFDARNGTQAFGEQIDELPSLLRLAAKQETA